MGLVGCLVLLLAGPAQDPEDLATRVRGLIEALSDDDPFRREEAQEALLLLGEQALPHITRELAGTQDAEVRDRAAQVAQRIEQDVEFAKACGEPRRFSIELSGVPAADAITRIAREAGLQAPGVADVPPTEVSLELNEVTLLQAMDTLCGQVESLSYQIVDGGLVLVNQAMPRHPAAYVDAFRLRVFSMTRTVTDNFNAIRAHMNLTLRADGGPEVRPISAVIEAVEATGANGETLEVQNRYRSSVHLLRMQNAIERPVGVTIRNLPPTLTGIRSLRARVDYRFAVSETKLRFDSLEVNSEVRHGEYVFRIAHAASNRIHMTISAGSDAVSTLLDVVDLESIRLIDSEQTTHIPRARPGGGNNQQVTVTIRLMQAPTEPLTAMTLTIRRIRSKRVDFELKNIPLPR